MLSVWGAVALGAILTAAITAWLLLRDTTPKPPGRHARRRHPAEPIRYDDQPAPDQDDQDGDGP